MSCCTDPKNHAPYAAEVPSGIAIACKKCGRARPATAKEAVLDLYKSALGMA